MVMSVRPSVSPSGSPSVSHSFPHFSPTCFDVLSWNVVCHFLLMNVWSSSSVVNLCQVLLELCPFCNLEYWKYTVFHTFLLHALTNWAEILHKTLFYCTTDQVWVSFISVNFCWSKATVMFFSVLRQRAGRFLAPHDTKQTKLFLWKLHIYNW